jgi:hypothetical protein
MFATQLHPHAHAIPCSSSDARLCDRIARIAEQGPEAVNRRLTDLNTEWTIGRWVKATCGLLLLVGVGLTALNPWWLTAVAVAAATLVQYWFFKRSWLGEVFAAFGVRPGAVIEDERIALRVLRGDFKFLPTIGEIREEDDAVSRMVDEGGPALEDDDDKLPTRQAAQLIAAGTLAERHG